jgi:hypothetical protein
VPWSETDLDPDQIRLLGLKQTDIKKVVTQITSGLPLEAERE